MATNYECGASVLLCAEDNSSILAFDDDDDEEQGGLGCGLVSDEKSCDFYGDFLVDLPVQSDECVSALVEREAEHMPREDYPERLRSGAFDSVMRRDAIDWICKVHAHYNFGPLCIYLAVNYLDRFLSANELPKGQAWMIQLLSVACLSLAAKMEETEIPLPLDLQVADAKYVFESRTIRRMELLMLSALKWKMQAVTPFSYIDFFLHKFNGGSAPSKLLVSHSVELMVNTIRGIDFLEFRPSEIAAAVALFALIELKIVEFDEAISCCIHVVKERVLRCYKLIEDSIGVRNMLHKLASSSVTTILQSPIGVLDATCLSYKSDDTTAGSFLSCRLDSPACKRRKISIS